MLKLESSDLTTKKSSLGKCSSEMFMLSYVHYLSRTKMLVEGVSRWKDKNKYIPEADLQLKTF